MAKKYCNLIKYRKISILTTLIFVRDEKVENTFLIENAQVFLKKIDQ